MADITDPEVIAFTNQRLRPFAEKLRAVKIEAASITAAWFGLGINTRTPNDASPLADRREAEGISRLTGADLNNLMGQLSIPAQLNQDIIEKPCVRGLEIR